MAIRHERLTGYPRQESMMTNFEFAGLFIAEQIFEQEEIDLKSETKQLLMMLCGVKPQ